MKRKVKFQEGGMVETPSQRRVRLSESFRDRAAEFRDAMRREAAQRAADQRAIDRLNPGMTSGEAERRAGRGVPERRPDFTTSPEGVTRRGAATGREVVPFEEPGRPPRPSASRALAEVGTPRSMPLGRVRPPVGGNIATMATGLATGLAEPLVNYGRDYAARRAAEADAQRELNLLSMRARTADAEGGDIAADAERQRQEAMRPAPRPARRPAAPAAREISADRLNDLMMGAEPTTAEERVAQMRMRGRQQELEGRRTAFRKGGMVKAKPVAKKAGGMIAAKPKKMMKGGVVAKPKSKSKPMPAFKKGGVVKKGKK